MRNLAAAATARQIGKEATSAEAKRALAEAEERLRGQGEEAEAAKAKQAVEAAVWDAKIGWERKAVTAKVGLGASARKSLAAGIPVEGAAALPLPLDAAALRDAKALLGEARAEQARERQARTAAEACLEQALAQPAARAQPAAADMAASSVTVNGGSLRALRTPLVYSTKAGDPADFDLFNGEATGPTPANQQQSRLLPCVQYGHWSKTSCSLPTTQTGCFTFFFSKAEQALLRLWHLHCPRERQGRATKQRSSQFYFCRSLTWSAST